MSQSAKFIVGIDLGTTHCAVASIRLDDPSTGPQVFPIDQLIAPGEVARQPLFPSNRYHPHQAEFDTGDLSLPWPDPGYEYGDPVVPVVQGALARHLGQRSLGRSVTSAKSWLSHSQVDREEPILPWGAEDDVAKVSPVTATAGYLRQLRASWDKHHPEAPLAQQYVVLTVPASFDEDARQLTLDAAEMAGVPVARLLEEPTAAFYGWFWQNQAYFSGADVRTLLVCDVGGGTTDLTLLRVTPKGTEPPEIERIGVGDHLLLGGDNMDLAVAWQAESSLGGNLSATALQQLAEESRRAKEICLSEAAPESVSVTLLGSGSRLIGGSRRAELDTGMIRRYLLENFFPQLELDTPLERSARGGALTQAGLPYERDPAITRHILRFVQQHQRLISSTGSGAVFPDMVLFNGGPFNSAILREHVLNVFRSWRGEAVEELRNPAPDVSVALGAVVHGMSLHGLFARVTGGSSRHYFLVTETSAGEEVGVCLLPKGSAEADPKVLAQRQFRLAIDQTVAFRVMTTTEDHPYEVGDLQVPKDSWHPLPPLVVRLESAGGDANVEVVLESELTEIGTLRIQCLDVGNPSRRWQLEFQTRRQGGPRTSDVSLHPQLDKAISLIRQFFQERQHDARSFKSLRTDLEQYLGIRDDWGLGENRALVDALLELADQRRRSHWHERAWLHWVGFCTRPGTGHPLDADRLEKLAGVYQQKVLHPEEQAVWAEWWNLWRRVAAGLDQALQQALLNDIGYFLEPSNARSRKRQAELAGRAYDDMVRLLGALEELSVDQKKEAGSWLFERLRKPGESPHTWWALGRIGARLPFSGRLDRVIPPAQIEPWLKELLRVDWRKQRVAALAATLLGRRSGDRAVDLDEGLRAQIVQKLKQAKAPERWIQLVEEVVSLDQEDQGSLFGESLPSGLVLLDT